MNNRGFTLFEILATILVFTLGILALAGTQILSTKGTAFNQDATTAATLAQKKLEELKESSFEAILDGTSTEKGMVVSWSAVSSGNLPYRIKDVTVTVTWASKTISVSTIIGE